LVQICTDAPGCAVLLVVTAMSQGIWSRAAPSRSPAEDAAHRAVADIADVVSPSDYRLIGGQMVTLLVARHRPPDAPERTTADVGMRLRLVADGAFVEALTARAHADRTGTHQARRQSVRPR
jgi:hypothetical protein